MARMEEKKQKLRVGLNLLYLVPGAVGGVETFGRELLQAFTEINDSSIEYVIFTSLDAQDLTHYNSSCMKVIVCPFRARSRGKRYLWEQFVLPIKAAREKVQVLHSFSYVGPVVASTPLILTIHDSNSKSVGAQMSWVRKTMLWNISWLASRTAKVVTTVSEFSKQELVTWYKLRPESIQVILSGPGRTSSPASDEPRAAFAGFESLGRYIAVIGGTYKHKNMPRLIEAYSRISGKIDHKLVIIGNLPPEAKDLVRQIGSDRIVLTGYLSDSGVRQVIENADLFVMPSLYEGFGFPVLEAQCRGIPVACSKRASLPEIVGSSAALFDPEDVEELSETLLRILQSPTTIHTMREQSAANAKLFSWHETARQYCALYKRVAG